VSPVTPQLRFLLYEEHRDIIYVCALSLFAARDNAFDPVKL